MTEVTLLRAGARPILRFERHLPRSIEVAWRAVTDPAGWDACLDRLQHGQEREHWQARFDRYTAELAPVLGHQDGPPAAYHETTS